MINIPHLMQHLSNAGFTCFQAAGSETIATDVQEAVNKDLEKMQPDVVADTLKNMTPVFLGFLYQLLVIIIIALAGKKLISILCSMLKHSLNRLNMEEGAKKFIISLVKALLHLVVVFIIAERLGISSSSLAAILGSAGIAIGLALQGSLSNFAGGMVVLFMKPFKVGDYISGAGVEGSVSMIGIIYTTIITADNKKITVPNASLSNAVVTNITAFDRRRLDISIGISYESDLETAKKCIKDIYANDKRIYNEPEVLVFVESFENSCIMLGSRAWCQTSEYLEVRWHILEQIKNKFDENGIEIPYNKIDVKVM